LAGRANRRAFTLLEVLLATSLAAVLMTALWSLLSMHVRLFTESPRRVEHAQLVRALFEQFAADLRSGLPLTPPDSNARSDSRLGRSPSTVPADTVVTAGTPGSPLPGEPTRSQRSAFSPTESADRLNAEPAGSGRFNDGNPAASSSRGVGSTQGQLAEPLGALAVPRLLGTADSLQIEVLQVSSPLDAPTRSDLLGSDANRGRDERADSARAMELKTVAYFFDRPGSTRSRTLEIPVGFRRCEVPWGTGDIPIEERGSEVWVVPQVIDVAFRYFDGARWEEEWDSLERGGLPLAVEIRLRLEEPVRETAVEQGRFPEKRGDPVSDSQRIGPSGASLDVHRSEKDAEMGFERESELAGVHRLVVAIPAALRPSTGPSRVGRALQAPPVGPQAPIGPASGGDRSPFP
jgi:prepilin-type N-terminal cleavage/methylation domain-containing protein